MLFSISFFAIKASTFDWSVNFNCAQNIPPVNVHEIFRYLFASLKSAIIFTLHMKHSALKCNVNEILYSSIQTTFVLLFNAFSAMKALSYLQQKSHSMLGTKSFFCAYAFKRIRFDCSSHYAEMLSFKFCEKCFDTNTSHFFTMSHFSVPFPLHYSRFSFYNMHKIFIIYSWMHVSVLFFHNAILK